jgi:SAM-dependent methyltransferase
MVTIDIENEREFHNKRFSDGDTREAQSKYYWAIEGAAQGFRDRLETLAVGKDVLEYGLGIGATQERLAPISKSFVGIDISDVVIERANANNRNPNARFFVMDAMNMSFEDNSFDLVYGSGIIHHIDVVKSAQEIKRILRPGGKAVFWEPLGLNPVINLYRKMTPAARTIDEHPLVPSDFANLRAIFGKVDIEYHGLLSLAAVAFRKSAVGPTLRTLLNRLDSIVLRLPFIGSYAWFAVYTCEKSGP